MVNKPASKDEHIKSIKREHKNLEKAFKGLSASDMIKTTAKGEWSIQDILAHLTAWENQFIEWYEAGMRREKVVLPDWSQPGIVDEINLGIYRRNLDRGLKEVKKEFKESYKRILKTAKSIPEETLFIPGRAAWTGKDTLADYLMSNTCGHYPEHIKMIQEIKQKNGM